VFFSRVSPNYLCTTFIFIPNPLQVQSNDFGVLPEVASVCVFEGKVHLQPTDLPSIQQIKTLAVHTAARRRSS